MSSVPKSELERKYLEAEQAYLRGLPLEHFMESTPQAFQRKITLASLDLVADALPGVHVFNELLVQYPFGRSKAIHQVVPDNMVVLHEGPIEARGSYNLPMQPVRPFLVLEYVSKSNRRKDYEDNFEKYEKELKVPYCLLFYPETQDLSLYRRGRTRYVSVEPNGEGRYGIERLELEVGLVEGWVRYYFRGGLLPLTIELQHRLVQTRNQLDATKAQLQASNAKLADAESEIARLLAELEQARRAGS